MRLLSAIAASLLFIAPVLAGEPTKFEPVKSEMLSKAPLATDFASGNKKAPVVLVEYASLSCPHCAHFHRDVLPELQKKYIDTGKLLYILRPFPLNAPALKGAMLLDCLGEKDGAEKYYTFANALFKGQSKWAFDMNYLSSLESMAKVGGVSAEQFKQCTDDKTRETKLLTLKKAADDNLKISHTPYVFINGYPYTDEATPAKISAFIDEQLKAKK